MKPLGIVCLLTLLVLKLCGQTPSTIQNPEAITQLTMFSDAPGIMDKVYLDGDQEKHEWKKKEGWIFSNEIDEYVLFGFNVVSSNQELMTLLTYENTEGSGEFAKLLQIEVTDNAYTLTNVIAEGDRCNGAVDLNNYDLDDNVFTYRVLITPHRIMNLLDQVPLSGYFDDCMVCCCGEAIYQVNLETGDKEFIKVLLTDTLEINNPFDKVYMDYVNKGSVELSRNRLTLFVKEVLSGIIEDNKKE